MKITRRHLRKLIEAAVHKTVSHQNEKISLTQDGTVIIRDKEYKLSVLKKAFGVASFVPISITKINIDNSKLMITGGALGQYETSELKPDSVNKITSSIKSRKNEFIVTPPKGEQGNTIKFELIS